MVLLRPQDREDPHQGPVAGGAQLVQQLRVPDPLGLVRERPGVDAVVDHADLLARPAELVHQIGHLAVRHREVPPGHGVERPLGDALEPPARDVAGVVLPHHPHGHAGDHARHPPQDVGVEAPGDDDVRAEAAHDPDEPQQRPRRLPGAAVQRQRSHPGGGDGVEQGTALLDADHPGLEGVPVQRGRQRRDVALGTAHAQVGRDEQHSDALGGFGGHVPVAPVWGRGLVAAPSVSWKVRRCAPRGPWSWDSPRRAWWAWSRSARGRLAARCAARAPSRRSGRGRSRAAG